MVGKSAILDLLMRFLPLFGAARSTTAAEEESPPPNQSNGRKDEPLYRIAEVRPIVQLRWRERDRVAGGRLLGKPTYLWKIGSWPWSGGPLNNGIFRPYGPPPAHACMPPLMGKCPAGSLLRGTFDYRSDNDHT